MSAIPCTCCGKFMAYAEMDDGGGATFHFEPLSEFGPEVSEWTCRRCNNQSTREGGLAKAPASNK